MTDGSDLRGINLFGRAILLCATLIGGVGVCVAQTPPMTFRSITATDGLSQNTVMDVHQDRAGFIWIATENGLDRYDGHNFERYERGPWQDGHLASDYVWQIAEDEHANLWLATDDGGVARWDRHSKRFSHYRHDPADPASLSSDRTRSLLITKDGIWVATQDAGLNLLNPDTGQVRRYRHDANDSLSLPNDSVYVLMEDQHGGIWIGTDRGLALKERAAQGFVRYVSGAADSQSLSGNRIRSLLQDRQGRIWIGTHRNGLNRLERRTGRIHRYRADHETPGLSLSDDHVRALYEDEAGRIWVGTAAGLNVLLPFSDRVHSYVATGRRGDLGDDYIMSLFQDRSGLLWIGTRVAGVHTWSPVSWEFGHRIPDWLRNSSVTAFATDETSLWIGTLEGGLFEVSRTSAVVDADVVTHTGVAGRSVMSLLVDRRNGLWVGTMSGGLGWRAAGTEEFVWFRHDPTDSRTLAHDSVMSVYEDTSGRIWIGSFGNGASRFDPKTGLFRQFLPDPSNPQAICGTQVRAFSEDRFGSLWVATEQGVCRFAANAESFQAFRHEQDRKQSLSTSSVYSLHRDREGVLWAGTAGGGLNAFEFDASGNVRFRPITRRQGLASNVIYGVLSDPRNGLWLSTNNGLTHFDSATGDIRNFNWTHGLQSQEYHFGAAHQSRDGRLYFGGSNGYNEFDSRDLWADQTAPRVVVTSIQKLNQPIHFDAPVEEVRSVEVPFDESSITFEFVALDFTSPETNKYRYRLNGFDDDWIETVGRSVATYTNLSPGEYAFDVKAATSNGSWGQEPLSLSLTVHPPLWRTSLAYAAYLIAVGLAFWWIFRYQSKRLSQAAAYRQRLETEVANRTAELEEANDALVRASGAKSEFVARMSHEIRSPIHGVLGMTELLSRTRLSDRQRHFTQTIRRSTESLLDIINDVLDFSKIGSNKLELDIESADLEGLLDEVIDQFSGVFAEKGVELRYLVPAFGFPALRFDALRLKQVLVNLLSNALKFTTHGFVELRADLLRDMDGTLEVTLTVRDTGIGIAADKQEHVFEAFSQEEADTARRFGGTGLGLSISKEIVELMGGELEVLSAPSEGTSFYFTLTLEKADARGFSPVTLDELVVEAQSPDIDLLRQVTGYLEAWNVDARGVDAETRDTLRVRLIDTRAQVSPPVQDGDHIIELIAPQDTSNRPHEVVTLPLKRTALLNRLQNLTVDDRVPEEPAWQPVFSATILVVEDNEINQEVLVGMLSEAGCTCVIAEDGASAVRLAAECDVDVILMDYLLPDFDGGEATRRIRAAEKGDEHIPIVALTANADAEDRRRCLDAGMDEFLAKPCRMEDLMQMLLRFLPEVGEAQRSPPPIHDSAEGEFDPEVLGRIRRLTRPDGGDMLTHAAQLFEKTCKSSLDGMRQAADGEDAASLRFHAHNLKSNAANLGAISMATTLREMERLAKTGDVSASAALIDEIGDHYVRASAWLKEELREQI